VLLNVSFRGAKQKVVTILSETSNYLPTFLNVRIGKMLEGFLSKLTFGLSLGSAQLLLSVFPW
jgi:hypothetical protein